MTKRKVLGVIKKFLRKYRISVTIVVTAIVVAGLGNSWYFTVQAQQIAINNTTTLAAQKSAEKFKAEAQAKAEAKLKAEEERLAAEAAERAAESAKTGTITDSKACNTAITHNAPGLIDVVVNKKHCIQPLNYAPSDLVTTHGATLSAKVSDAFNQLYNAAQSAGQPFYVTSSYRSYASQVSVYNRWVSISGAEGADTYSARAGYSEHQTGFAFDVAADGCTLDCFGTTSQYAWFQEHAAEYGFIQRYYKGYTDITGYTAEEWHYRYVGVAVAKDMKARGIMTLEQYWGVTGGNY